MSLSAGQPALPAGLDPLALLARWPQRYPALLESSASNPVTGRHDFMPIADGRFLALAADGLVRDQDGRCLGDDFGAALDAAWRAQQPSQSTTPPPDAAGFAGGWLLYLGYEAVVQFEPSLNLPAFAGTDLPLALAIRTPAAWWRDRINGRSHCRAEPGHEHLRQRLLDDVQVLAGQPAAPMPPLPRPEAILEDDPGRFLAGVERILEYLHAGDVFQVNLSRGWQARFADSPEPVALYRRLRQLGPAPFSALLRWQGSSILSASPERLLRVRGDRIETRPIAGTRPRGQDAAQDQALREQLLAHPKERAEHVMLIDLERNDLGRLCQPGSVVVDEMMALESYAHVHHIVSNVAGRLRPGTTPGAILRALFPGGTITGCPKVRCMQIIAELEGVGRGPYTGAIGWLGHDGDMDLNILIRSAWLHGNTLGFRTGAGIVVDSVPVQELAETRTKAAGMLALLGAAP
ncbi:MAG: aminodeoxychorismate synthase component I [Xanthomonadales bacterium]|nr:aminodeoxychorismate synthase component I [Xanthomonadales bacterium]